MDWNSAVQAASEGMWHKSWQRQGSLHQHEEELITNGGSTSEFTMVLELRAIDDHGPAVERIVNCMNTTMSSS